MAREFFPQEWFEFGDTRSYTDEPKLTLDDPNMVKDRSDTLVLEWDADRWEYRLFDKFHVYETIAYVETIDFSDLPTFAKEYNFDKIEINL